MSDSYKDTFTWFALENYLMSFLCIKCEKSAFQSFDFICYLWSSVSRLVQETVCLLKYHTYLKIGLRI